MPSLTPATDAGPQPARRVAEGPEGAPEGPADGPAPTGLVLEGRLETDPDGVGWSLREGECPLSGAVSIDRTTGEVAWVPSCKSARCRGCSRRVSARTFALARRVAELETAADGWVRFITLTRAPEGWQETRGALRDWRQYLRRQGYAMHTLSVVERGSETGMKHVHVIQRGDFVPKAVLEASWPHGSTQIAAARDAAADYLAKGVVKYVAKGIDGSGEEIEDHMNLNGGRAAHWSREFFMGAGRDDFAKRFPIPGHYFVETITDDKRPDRG